MELKMKDGAKNLIPVLVAFALIGGVVVAAVAISNLWLSPNVNVYEPQKLVVGSPGFTAQNIEVGSTYAFNITLSNPNTYKGYTGVTVHIRFLDASDNAIAPEDVTVEYYNGTSWLALAFVQEGASAISSVLEPSGGIDTPPGYSATTQLRATFNTAGLYHVEAQAYGDP